MQFPTKKHFCCVLQCNVLCTLCIELNTLQCIVYTVCILYTVLCRKQGSAHCTRVEWTRISDFTTLTCGCLPPIQPCCTLQCNFYYMSPNFSELAKGGVCTFQKADLYFFIGAFVCSALSTELLRKNAIRARFGGPRAETYYGKRPKTAVGR